MKLPKKIAETIKTEISPNFEIIRNICIDNDKKHLRLNLIALKREHGKYYLVRYWGDNSYSIVAGYNTTIEIMNELKYQIEKLL